MSLYKQLLIEAVYKVTRGNYSSVICYQVKTIVLDLKQYEGKKAYTSVIDFIIVALGKVASLTQKVSYVDEVCNSTC